MKSSHLIALVCVSLPCFLSPAMGQERERDSASTSAHTMRVAAFGAPLESVFYECEGRKVELSAGVSSISCDLPMPKGKVLRLYREISPQADAAIKSGSQYLDAGTIALPDGPKAVVILLVPEDLVKVRIQGRAFEDSYRIHPAGTARVFNMSPKEVALRADSDGLSLKVGETGVMPWKAIAFNSVPYQLAIRGGKADTWDLVENAECASRADLRTFVFVSEATYAEKKTVSAVTVSDSVPETNGE